MGVRLVQLSARSAKEPIWTLDCEFGEPGALSESCGGQADEQQLLALSRLLEALYSGDPDRVTEALAASPNAWPKKLDVKLTFAPLRSASVDKASARVGNGSGPQALYNLELHFNMKDCTVRIAEESVEVGGRIRKLARGYGGGSWFAGDTDPPETTDWVGHLAQPEGNNPVMVVLPLIGDALRSLRAATA